MGIATVFNLVIGLAAIYALLALIVSAVNEWIAGLFRFRGGVLKRGVTRILGSPELAARFYEHPRIQALYEVGGRIEGLPSYIEPMTFVRVVFDSLEENGEPLSSTDQARVGVIAAAVAEGEEAGLLGKDAIATLRGLLAEAQRAGGGTAALGDLEERMERVFNDTMNRASGWYKRQIQLTLFLVGLATSVAVNADTIHIARSLYENPAQMEAVAQVADSLLELTDEQKLPENAAETASELLDAEMLGSLPLGWKDDPLLRTGTSAPTAAFVATRIVGWLMTAAAISMGAPFWFDLLSSLARGAGPMRKEDEDEPE